MKRITLPVAALLSLSILAAPAANEAGSDAAAMEIFNQRILPIFRSPNPSSCVQCHLSAVDLKDYILPSHEKTFASLRAQGMIDLDHPGKSKILELIQMGEKDYDKGAKMIHEKNRKAEYEAFAAWIKACCNDPELRNLPAPDPAEQAGPEEPLEVIRHARKSRVLDSFVRNVWSQRMRCFPCHTPYEIDEDNPKHKLAAERLKKMEKKMGIRFTSRLRLFRETPEETLDHLVRDSRETSPDRLPLINLDQPEKSLLVLKPTSKLPKKIGDQEFEKPSYVEPVSHMGGLKMHPDDHSYKAFVAWIQDYAKVVDGKYRSVAELPADNWHPSQHMIMMREVPDAWKETSRVQFFVHGWDQEKDAWAADPLAFTQGTVNPRRTVFGALFLLKSDQAGSGVDWSGDQPSLKPGKFLLKAYVDSKHKLAEDPTALLGDEDFYGQGVHQAKWGATFKEREMITGALFQK